MLQPVIDKLAELGEKCRDSLSLEPFSVGPQRASEIYEFSLDAAELTLIQSAANLIAANCLKGVLSASKLDAIYKNMADSIYNEQEDLFALANAQVKGKSPQEGLAILKRCNFKIFVTLHGIYTLLITFSSEVDIAERLQLPALPIVISAIKRAIQISSYTVEGVSPDFIDEIQRWD